VRKRRAIVFDDESIVLEMLDKFLSSRGYEVSCFSEPLVCPIFKNNEQPCYNEKPCADILITDFKMPGMNGIELLERQVENGCKLDIRNKALISGFIDEEEMKKLTQLGCVFFRKPFRLSELSAWIDACEERMPISVEIAVPRKERREPVLIDISYSVPSLPRKFSGVVTNLSKSGFCLKTDHNLSEKDLILVNSDLPIVSKTAAVRWTRRLEGGSFMAGFACC
jgi:CheY-like chemotaxis protein